LIAAPFRVDEGVARRMAELGASVAAAVEADIRAIVQGPSPDPLGGSTLPAAAAADLVERHGLASERELALLALPVATAMARPPISGYRVGAIGIERESGALVLGANLEFPGADLGSTVHAEGFVALRARRRGATLEALAVREAHPCAHCRQTLAESAAADDLEVIDPLGHELTLAELYPWPFRPDALGIAGDRADGAAWPGLAFLGDDPPSDVAELLRDVGLRAHAPYSGAPSAVALQFRDGRLLAAAAFESVAFNPSITALQAALVELIAARSESTDIARAWLARTAGGSIDPAPGFRGLLAAVAPTAEARVVDWRNGA
jgi:cytidine deaminase